MLSNISTSVFVTLIPGCKMLLVHNMTIKSQNLYLYKHICVCTLLLFGKIHSSCSQRKQHSQLLWDFSSSELLFHFYFILLLT